MPFKPVCLVGQVVSEQARHEIRILHYLVIERVSSFPVLAAPPLCGYPFRLGFFLQPLLSPQILSCPVRLGMTEIVRNDVRNDRYGDPRCTSSMKTALLQC